MSSNIRIQRICQHCGNEFTAHTTVTKFCSQRCASRNYKKRERAALIAQSVEETNAIRNRPIEELKQREFLSVRQVSQLLGCSRQNVYKLIRAGKLKATNILKKKTIIRRADIDQIFETR